MCNTAKFPDWFNFENQVFSLVETMSSISWSLHDFSQQELNHAHSLHIYTCHTPHILWKNLKHALFEIVYEEEKEPQNKSMPILYELQDNSMTFTPFLPKNFTTYTSHNIFFQECHSLLPTVSNNNMMFLFQNVTYFQDCKRKNLTGFPGPP